MKRMLASVMPLVLLFFALSLGSGCALVNGTTQRVNISTSVPDAEVIVDGRPVGKTRGAEPLVVVLKRAENHVVVARKEGYTSKYITVSEKLSTLGILDAIGTWIFLLPGISIVTGCAMELDPSDVYVALDPVQAPASLPVPSTPSSPASTHTNVPENMATPPQQSPAPPPPAAPAVASPSATQAAPSAPAAPAGESPQTNSVSTPPNRDASQQ